MNQLYFAFLRSGNPIHCPLSHCLESPVSSSPKTQGLVASRHYFMQTSPLSYWCTISLTVSSKDALILDCQGPPEAENKWRIFLVALHVPQTHFPDLYLTIASQGTLKTNKTPECETMNYTFFIKQSNVPNPQSLPIVGKTRTGRRTTRKILVL